MTETKPTQPPVMFQGYTMEQQRVHEAERGWKTSFAALTYCTAEAVPFRFGDGLNDLEILVSTRVTGAVDCVGIDQVKYGTYCMPTDPTARHAIARELKDMFCWDLDAAQFKFAGLVSQWLYKSTLYYSDGDLVLDVSDIQAEQTPFQATLFYVDATGLEIGTGPRSKAIADPHWVPMQEFVRGRGSDNSWAYAQMLFMARRRLALHNGIQPDDMLQQFEANKEYGLILR